MEQNQIIAKIPDNIKISFSDGFNISVSNAGAVISFGNANPNDSNELLIYDRVGMSIESARALIDTLQQGLKNFDQNNKPK